MMSHRIANVLVLGIALMSCSPQEDHPEAQDQTAEIQSEERHVPLDGQPNFRDLGGYSTVDGQTVRSGLVFRSGELNKLTDADLAALQDLGIKTVVDFRSEYEVKSRGPDRLPAGARYLPLRIDSGDLASILSTALETGDLSQVPDDVLADANRALIRDAAVQYSILLNTLSDPASLPLVFHCTHGKDRAGIAAAILLMAVGVSEDVAREDYLASNHYRAEQNRKELDQLRRVIAQRQEVDPTEVDTRKLDAIYLLESSYFDAMLSEVESEHGSFFPYLESRLGISEAARSTLMARLLENGGGVR